MGKETGKMQEVAVMLPADLIEAITRLAREKRITRGSVVRMLLSERLMELGEIEPQPPRSGPAGPGVSAMGAAGRAGPKTGGDAPQPIEKNQKGGGLG
jgi:hypothetical protein